MIVWFDVLLCSISVLAVCVVFGCWCGAVYVMMDYAVFCAGFDRENSTLLLVCCLGFYTAEFGLGFVEKPSEFWHSDLR